MTKPEETKPTEFQEKYANLCAVLGERLILIKKLQAQMDDLQKQIDQLLMDQGPKAPSI